MKKRKEEEEKLKQEILEDLWQESVERKEQYREQSSVLNKLRQQNEFDQQRDKLAEERARKKKKEELR